MVNTYLLLEIQLTVIKFKDLWSGENSTSNIILNRFRTKNPTFMVSH